MHEMKCIKRNAWNEMHKKKCMKWNAKSEMHWEDAKHRILQLIKQTICAKVLLFFQGGICHSLSNGICQALPAQIELKLAV